MRSSWGKSERECDEGEHGSQSQLEGGNEDGVPPVAWRLRGRRLAWLGPAPQTARAADEVAFAVGTFMATGGSMHNYYSEQHVRRSVGLCFNVLPVHSSQCGMEATTMATGANGLS